MTANVLPPAETLAAELVMAHGLLMEAKRLLDLHIAAGDERDDCGERRAVREIDGYVGGKRARPWRMHYATALRAVAALRAGRIGDVAYAVAELEEIEAAIHAEDLRNAS